MRSSYDKVMKGGTVVGFSTFSSYSFNERSMLSMGIIENEYSDVGTELTIVWGEEDGGSAKPTVERHRQIEIRATVGPVPYAEPARLSYASGWRTSTRPGV
jgi:vanillate/3-O-methylgallate O-demethylase